MLLMKDFNTDGDDEPQLLITFFAQDGVKVVQRLTFEGKKGEQSRNGAFVKLDEKSVQEVVDGMLTMLSNG